MYGDTRHVGHVQWKLFLNEIADSSYTLLANVSHNTTTTGAGAVLSSSFQHKSQLFSSAPAPEASSSSPSCHSF